MKKKLFTMFFCALLVLSFFTSCDKKVECSLCGEEKKCTTRVVFGEEISVCDDCINEWSEF